jgi:hypothetical protein
LLDFGLNHPRCISEYEEIKDGIELEGREGFSSYRELFSKGKFNNRKRVLLGMLSQIIQQPDGINVGIRFF